MELVIYSQKRVVLYCFEAWSVTLWKSIDRAKCWETYLEPSEMI